MARTQRGLPFTNANKRSIGINLRADAGREAALRLSAGADIFVQSLRPGSAERLGLGFERVRARKPDVIYCSVGTFGSVGPLRDQPGYDPLMLAAGGIMSVTGEEGRPPVRSGVSIVDQGTGLWAAIGILAALRVRDLGAAGAQLVDTSPYEPALNWVQRQLVEHFATGEVPTKLGSALGILAPYQAFRAADDWIVIGAANDRLFASLCEAVRLPQLVDDPRFATNEDRVANRDELITLLAEPLAAAPATTWLERLSELGVPAAPVQDMASASASAQTKALGILQELPHDAIPDLRVVAAPLSVNGSRLVHRTPAPELGEHSCALLVEAGYAPSEVFELIRDGVITASTSGEAEAEAKQVRTPGSLRRPAPAKGEHTAENVAELEREPPP